MTAITCINCGVEGVLKMHGLENSDALKVFKRVGRNHFSGHLHYKCPVCEMVLLVDPALVRENTHIFKRKLTDQPASSSGSTYLPSIHSMSPSFAPSTPI